LNFASICCGLRQLKWILWVFHRSEFRDQTQISHSSLLWITQSVFFTRQTSFLQGQQKSQITRSHRTHALAGNRVIFSAEVVRYHVRFLWAQTEELKKRGYKLFQLLVSIERSYAGPVLKRYSSIGKQKKGEYLITNHFQRGSSVLKCSSSAWVLFPCFSNERRKNKNLLFPRENRIVGLIKGSGPEEKGS